MIKTLKITPHFEYRVWADNNIQNFFHLKEESIGEAWIISGYKNKTSKIENLNQQDLLSFYEDPKNAYFFGDYNLKNEYPLLVKIIDAKDDLSVQIHPDDQYAKQFNSLGKTECWYILGTKENNSVVLGHNAKSKEEFVSMVNNGQWDQLLKSKPIQKDDFIYVESTKIHAIKGGTLIYELQQSSDITYRVYDYDRLDKGKKRELHLDHVFNVVKAPDVILDPKEISDIPNYLVHNKMFNLIKIENQNKNDYYFEEALWTQLTIIEGSGKVNGIDGKRFDSFLIAHKEKIELDGNMKCLISYVK